MIQTTFKFTISTAILLIFLLNACTPKNTGELKSVNEIDFDTLHVVEQYFLENNSEDPSCNITLNLQYPVHSTQFDIEAIQETFTATIFGSEFKGISLDDAAKKYIEGYIDNYKVDAEIYKTIKPGDELEESFDDIYLSDSEHHNIPDIFYSYFETISNEVVFNQYGVLSFQLIQTNNKGGHISHESVRNYTLNLTKNELLTEEDIFSAGFDEALRSIIQNLLMEREGVKTIQQLEDLGFFGIDEIVPNKNFLLTEQGILYTFNKGEYSAYQLPPAEILIPFSSVRSLLRENSIAQKISKSE